MKSGRKNWISPTIWLVGAFLVMFILTRQARAEAPQVAAGLQTGPAGPTITVGGQGAARIQPDRAEALIGVEIAAPTPQGAAEQVGLQTEALMAALVEQGLAAEDIQPEDFKLTIQPALTGAGGDTSAPYVAGQKIRLLIRDVSQVEQVLLTAVETGANQVEAVNFMASDISAPTTEARQKAVTQAQNNADALAMLTGVKVGALYQIEELVSYTPGWPEVTVQVKITYTIE